MTAKILHLNPPTQPARPHREKKCLGQHPRCEKCKALVESLRKFARKSMVTK